MARQPLRMDPSRQGQVLNGFMLKLTEFVLAPVGYSVLGRCLCVHLAPILDFSPGIH